MPMYTMLSVLHALTFSMMEMLFVNSYRNAYHLFDFHFTKSICTFLRTYFDVEGKKDMYNL